MTFKDQCHDPQNSQFKQRPQGMKASDANYMRCQ